MKARFTLSRAATSINSLPSWVDFQDSNGVWTYHPGVGQQITIGSFQGSSNLADNIINPYVGTYNFTVSATGSINGGSGNTAQITFIFYDEDRNILDTSDPVTIPNAGIVDEPVAFVATVAPSYVGISINNLTGSSNTITISDVTYIPPVATQEIAEPGGWQNHEITLERHPEFCSLVESIFSEDKFVFIGDDDEDGNGGIDFILDLENGGAMDEKIQVLIEFAPDDVTYENYFSGLLDLEGLIEFPDNEIEVPIIREDDWSKFINRWNTPVDVSSTVDLDGNPVDPIEPVTINLTSQKIQARYHAYIDDGGVSYAQFTSGTYYQIDFSDVIILDELKERYSIPRLENTELPAGNFVTEYAGDHTFNIRIIASTFTTFDAESVKTPTDLIDYYIQFGNDAPIAFSWADETVGSGTHTVFTYSDTVELVKNQPIRIYGKANNTSTKDLVILGGDSTGFSGSSPYASYCEITAATIFPDTEVQGYWIHDLCDAIIKRISPSFGGLYSEKLGATFTNARQYDVDGCYSNFVCIKGLHIRGYTLDEKPFFMSMKEWWDGVNPIFNLGLAHEYLEESPDVAVIRIEDKPHFYDTPTSVNFDHVILSRSYDKDKIFKKITVGYNKWESESTSGIDDPQTKHTYATRFGGSGKDISLVSGFIAASLAIETTRRMTADQSADYKFDNDTFIIAMNPNEATPEIYSPELEENFTSVAGLLYSDTRYNLILTPLRNFLRWSNYIAGCLQAYLSSKIRFVSGEGNFDMQSDYDCAVGKECPAVICDEVTESQDISLSTYSADLGYIHLPLLYEMVIPMEWEEYKLIRDNPKNPIGISQTDAGHAKFYIKQLRYNIMAAEAKIHAWPKEYFDIQVVENTPEMACIPEPDPSSILLESGDDLLLESGDLILLE